MRAIFGLVGILVVFGVILWIMKGSGSLDRTHEVIKTSQTARQEINQLGGNDPLTGERASESADLDVQSRNGKLSSVLVTKVAPGGAYERFFGLQRGDSIVAVIAQGSRLNIRDMNGDPEMAKAQIMEAFQRRGGLVVVRDGKEMTLTATAPTPPGATPAKKDSLQGQLDAIQAAPR